MDADQNLCCASTLDPSFLQAHSEDWLDWADAQADQSLHWAHIILLASRSDSYFKQKKEELAVFILTVSGQQ